MHFNWYSTLQRLCRIIWIAFSVPNNVTCFKRNINHLMIIHPRKEDQGRYRCTVTVNGTTISQDTQLQVGSRAFRSHTFNALNTETCFQSLFLCSWTSESEKEHTCCFLGWISMYWPQCWTALWAGFEGIAAWYALLLFRFQVKLFSCISSQTTSTALLRAPYNSAVRLHPCTTTTIWVPLRTYGNITEPRFSIIRVGCQL